jgi:hypothetical protein
LFGIPDPDHGVYKCDVDVQHSKGEGLMIHMSEKAEEVLKDYFKEKEITPIRIFLQTGG